MQENIDFGKHESLVLYWRMPAYGKYQTCAGIRWHTLEVRLA
jgi:hypothetical protein